MSARPFDPGDPLGRIAALAEPDLRAMGRVSGDLIVAEWERRLAPRAAALPDLGLAAEMEDDRLRGWTDDEAERLRRDGWRRALRAELQRRRAAGQGAG